MALVKDPQTGAWRYDAEELVEEPAGMPAPKSGILRRAVGDPLTAAAKGVLVGVPQAAVGLARLATLGLADPVLDPVADQLSDMGKRIDKSYSPEHQQQAQEVAATKGFFPTIGAYLSRPGLLADTIVEQLPSMYAGGKAGQLAAGGKGAVAAGAVGEGLITAGQNVEQIHEAAGGQSTVGQKLLGGLSGATTGMITHGAGKLSAKLGITDVDTLMAGGGRGTGKLLPSVGKGMLSEGVLEELPQSMTEQMWTNTALDRPLTEGVSEAGAAGLVLGSAMGGGAQLLNRPDPAAVLHDKRMSDALAGIQILSMPAEQDANGQFVTKAHDEALRAVAAYARSVNPDFDTHTWVSNQQEAINKGGKANFDGLPGVTSDEAAKAWAANRISELQARAVAPQEAVDSTRAFTDDFGTEQIVADAPYQPEVAGRSLTKQEKAEIAKLEAALASGDAQEVARLQNKLAYLTTPPATQAAAAAAAPAEDIEVAPPPTPTYKPNDPRGWDDATLAKAAAALTPSDVTPSDEKVRREVAVRAERTQQLTPTSPMPDAGMRKLGMKALKQAKSRRGFSDATIKAVEAEVARALPQGGTVKQLVDVLSAFAKQNESAETSVGELAGMYVDRLSAFTSSQGAPDVQATNVNPGSQPGAGNTKNPAAVPKADTGSTPARDAAGESAEKATEKATAEVTAPPVQPKAQDRVVTAYNKHGTVTEVTPAGVVKVTLDDGSRVAYPAKAIADGQLRVAPPAAAKAAPATPKATEPTAEDWDRALAAAKAQADKLGLKLADAANPADADGNLIKLAAKISDKVKDPEARAELRRLVAVAREAIKVEMVKRKNAFAADTKTKDDAKVAAATAVLQEPAKPAPRSAEGRWDAARGDKTTPTGIRYIPTWAEAKQYLKDVAEMVASIPKLKEPLLDLKDRVQMTREVMSAANKAVKAAQKKVDELVSKGKKAHNEAEGFASKQDELGKKANAILTRHIADLLKPARAQLEKATRALEDATDAYTQASNEVKKVEKAIKDINDEQMRATKLVALMEQFKTAEGSEFYTQGDLLNSVAEARLAPYLKELRELAKAAREQASEKARYEHEKEELLDLADKWNRGDFVTKAEQARFLELYRSVMKGNAKYPNDFSKALDHVTTTILYHIDDSLGTIVPAYKFLLQQLNGTKGLAALLQNIGNLSDNAEYRELAALAQKLGVDGVTLVYKDELSEGTLANGKKAYRRGTFNSDTNTLTIYRGGENAQVILHEVVHALTTRALNRAAALVDGGAHTQQEAQMKRGYLEMTALFTALKAMPQFADQYAFKNIHEFVAEVNVNPQLRLDLALTKAPPSMAKDFKVALKSMMDAFIEAMRNLLGLPPGSKDSLMTALELAAQFFEGNNAGPQGGGTFDALETPTGAATIPFARLRKTVSELDTKLATTPFADVKASAYKVWLGMVSSDYIKSAVDRMPTLKGVKDQIEAWFAADQQKTQVKNLISKDVYDGFMRSVELELQKTGNYAKYNALMSELAGEASILGIDLQKNFDQNNVGRGAKGQHAKVDEKFKAHVNELHQKFMALKRSPKLARIAELILEGEKVNRKLHTMGMATNALNILRHFAMSSKSPVMAKRLLDQFEPALNILQDTRGLTNVDKSKHMDALASHLHTRLMDLFNTDLPHGDLHDDLRFLRKSYLNSWDAPYMHLGRHGDYSVRFATADTSPQTVAKLNQLLGKFGFVFGQFQDKDSTVFLRVDTLAEMNQIRQVLEKNNNLLQKKDGAPVLAAGAISEVGVENMFGVSKAMSELRTRMQTRMADMKASAGKSPQLKQAYDDIQAILTQEFVDMLDKNSARQANQKREGRPGYSADYMRNFGKRAQWAESTIATQYTTQKYTEAFREMARAIQTLESSDSKMAVRGQAIHDELATRFSNSLKPNSSPVATTLSTFGHNFYLALSPAYFIGNLLQPYMITLPLLGGRFGFVKSAKAMGKATADVFSVVEHSVKTGWADGGWRGILDAQLDFSKSSVKPDELAFLQHLIRSGIVDATQAHELGRLAKGTSSTAATMAKTLSVTNHYSEVANRLSAGLAAYRLAKGSGIGSPEQYAIDAVRRTQYDYSDHVQARYLSRHGVLGSVTPLAFQFQTFAFRTMEHYLRMVKDGFIEKDVPVEERKAARAALAETLAVTAVMTGTMGLPFATVFAALANSGDEDKDARARYRAWLSSLFGDKTAELIAKGVIPRGVLGIDVTGQLGQQDLLPLSRWMADRRAFEGKIKDQSRTMLGPAVNAGFDIYGGMAKAAEGDIAGGIKQLLPRALKGPAEALRTAQEGAFVNKAGDPLPIPVGSWDYAKLALGFQPQRKADQSEANFYYQSEQTQRKQDKAKAKLQAMKAIREGDFDEMATIIAEHNAAHPDNPLTGQALSQVLAAKARGLSYAKASGTGILDGNTKHYPQMLDYGWATPEED